MPRPTTFVVPPIVMRYPVALRVLREHMAAGHVGWCPFDQVAWPDGTIEKLGVDRGPAID